MCTVFKRIQSGIKQLTMFINLCCFKCFPASFFSLTANTYLQLSFELTPPACHSSDPSSPPPPPFSEVLPSPSSQLCRWRRQSQAQGLKSREGRVEFVPLIPILIGKNDLGKDFFSLIPVNSLKST